MARDFLEGQSNAFENMTRLSTFKVLADANVIEKEFSLELAKMARFRNRLVHLYWDVDISEIWKILQSRLEDFEKYISQIGAFIAKGD